MTIALCVQRWFGAFLRRRYRRIFLRLNLCRSKLSWKSLRQLGLLLLLLSRQIM